MAQSTSSERSWSTSSVAPSRSITGRAARACPSAAAVSPRFIVRSARLVWSCAGVHGPSSSRTSASAPAAASTAPAGSPTFSRAWVRNWSAGRATWGSGSVASRSSRAGNAAGSAGSYASSMETIPVSRGSPPPGPSRASSSRIGSLRRSSVTMTPVIAVTSAARAVSSSSGGGCQSRTASATAAVRAIRRACSPRIVQKSPSTESSSTSAPRSPSASVSRSSSARLTSSAAIASIVANWSRSDRPARWRSA